MRRNASGIVIALFALLFGASFIVGSSGGGLSLVKLAIATNRITVIVSDIDTGAYISGALIEFDQHSFAGQPNGVDFSSYTDSKGVAERTIAQGLYTMYVLAQGFIDGVFTEDLRLNRERGSQTVRLGLKRDTTLVDVPSGETVEFYLVERDDARMVSGGVVLDGVTRVVDEEGYVRFEGVPQGTYMVQFWGRYPSMTSPFVYVNFNFEKEITVVAGTNRHTVFVTTEQDFPNTEPPPDTNPDDPAPPTPPTPPPPGRFNQWIIIGFGFMVFAVLFWGQGDELIKMAIGK